MKQQHFVKTTAALTLALAALAEPALAVTNIDKCQTLSKSGSYKLTQDLTANGNDCFVITASNVTLDLGGHTLSGPRAGAQMGVIDSSRSPVKNQFGIRVRNGAIEGFWRGVYLRVTHGAVIENLRVSENTDVGIYAGPGAVIRKNTVTANAYYAIYTGRGSLVTANTVEGNGVGAGSPGILAAVGSIIDGNAVRLNTRVGINMSRNKPGVNPAW